MRTVGAPMTNNRRELLRMVGLAALTSTAAAGPAESAQGGGPPNPDLASLQGDFDSMVSALNAGEIERFWAYFHPSAVMIDEDSPWRFDLAGIKDHIGFHGGGVWESFAWRPRDLRRVVRGDTGVVAGAATFRGKPKDAGYRLRYMLFTQGWLRTNAGWRVVLWHQSPVIGHLVNGSPG